MRRPIPTRWLNNSIVTHCHEGAKDVSARVSEISSTSVQSFEEAIRQGIERATQTWNGFISMTLRRGPCRRSIPQRALVGFEFAETLKFASELRTHNASVPGASTTW